MKTKQELLQMLFAKLAELQNMIKIGVQPSLLMVLQAQEAIDLVRETKEELMNRPCSDGADIIMDNLGLEPDYIMDILGID